LACEGGTAGVAGVAGLAAGGFADRAGTAGVARSGVCEPFVGLGAAGGGEAEGFGALAVGGAEAVPLLLLPPPEVGWPGAGVLGVGEGAGATGVVPPGGVAGTEPRPGAAAGLLDTKIGVKPEKTSGAAGFVTTCGRPGETSTGTLRTCVLGMASSRVAEGSSTVKACSQSCADATAPAATAPA
jgi:hypothetical protein